MERFSEYITHHPTLIAAALLSALVLVVFELVERRKSFAAITPQDLIHLQNKGALVLDLRKPEDFAGGHISGARHMSSADILTASDSLRKHKEKPIIVYCDSGSVGASAASILNGQGFKQAFNLRDGLNAWRTENLPLTAGQNKV